MASVIRLRRGTTTQWNASTRILQIGELGLDTTLNKIKSGDGTSLWGALPFLNVLPSEITELSQDAVSTALSNGTHSNITVTYNDTNNTISLSTGPDVITQTSLSNTLTNSTTGYVPLGDVGQADGVASLDSNGKIPDSEIPAGIARDTEIITSYNNLTDKPTIPNLAGYATESYVTTAVSNLVDAAPGTLNTLNELAAAINDDASFASTVTTALGNKLDSSTAASTYLSISEPSVDYYITNSGSGSYTVNGISNGLISFQKGKKYRIHINASGHPFWIQTVSGAYSAGNVYSDGVTNGGAQVGHIIVELPQSAPDNLYYVCQFHSSMQGSISVQSEDLLTINSKAGNYTILPIDLGRLIEVSGAGIITITDSSSFPIGFSVDVLQTGSSQVSIAGNGFTPDSTPGLKLRTRWSSATLIKRGLNSWVVIGDLSA
jgi:hypothetical protein